MNYSRHQTGFTLLELMIAIALGLLIVAAGLSLFINGLKSSKTQEGVLQIQDSGIFGLEFIAEQVRLANYGNVEYRSLNDQSPFGGIIFTTGIFGSTNVNFAVGNAQKDTAFTQNILTHSFGEENWSGLGNTNQGSDQLTIQFIAPIDMRNCEGETVFRGDRVVQRYFLRVDTHQAEYDKNLPRLGLACNANTPATSADSVQPSPEFVTGFSETNTGEIIIPDVDYFGILLGARQGNNFQYYTVAEYRAAVEAARNDANATIPAVEIIKMAVLVRSSEEARFSDFDPKKVYSIFGKNVSLKAPAESQHANKFARQVYYKTISIRNAQGDRL